MSDSYFHDSSDPFLVSRRILAMSILARTNVSSPVSALLADVSDVLQGDVQACYECNTLFTENVNYTELSVLPCRCTSTKLCAAPS